RKPDDRQPDLPPLKDRLLGHPAEVVKVFGDERGRHWGAAEQVVWSGTGWWGPLASCGPDGIRVWDGPSLKEQHWIKDTHIPRGVALSPDGKPLAAIVATHYVQLWHLDGKTPVKGRMLRGPPGGLPVPTHVAFTPDGKTVQALALGGWVMRWKLRGDSEQFE